MLKPEYLSKVPASMVELYSQAEIDILTDMARRISTYDYWIPAAEHQAKVLEEMGMVREEIITRLKGLTGKSQKELTSLMNEAAEVALKSDDAVYKRSGLNPGPVRAAKPLQKVLQSGYKKTQKLFDNLTLTTAKTAGKQFENALNRAYMQISLGGMDYNSAIRNTIKELSKQGVGAVTYPTGKIDSLETAVRRATITGVNQTALKMQEARADEMGCDLVETSAHAGARPSHVQWQGEVFSRSGKSKRYPDFVQSTGYGKGDGLGGWNCSHSFSPYFEGSPRTYSKDQLEEYQEKSFKYNGRKMTEYEAVGEQRNIERNIRRWKREQSALRAAGDSTDEASAKIKSWQEREKDFLNQTGLKKQTDRSQIAGYSKSEAQKTNWEYRKEIEKYDKIRYNKDKSIIVTDNWTDRDRPSIPPMYKHNAVVDTTSRKGTQFDRTIYGEDGRIKQQIHWGTHGNAKNHPYGKSGEHVHDFTWIPNEKKPDRVTRELTDEEYIMHKNLVRREDK